MKTNLRTVMAGALAAGMLLAQANVVIAEDTAAVPVPPEEVMYLYNRDCEDLTLGETVGVGPYLSSTKDVMDRTVAAPAGSSENGKSIKVTAQAGSEQFYKIFEKAATWFDGDETVQNPAEYNNEVVVRFDVYREADTRTPNFTIQNINMKNMTLASAFIDKDGKLSVATSSEIKSMPQETATDQGYFVYDQVLAADQWHTITIVYNKDAEKTTWFADGNYVCDAVFPTKNATYQELKGYRYSMQCFALVNEKLAASAYIDNIKIAYAKPAETMQIQTELYSNDAEQGVTVTGPGSASKTVAFDSIQEVSKDYIVSFDLRADTITAKGACITLQNAAGNMLATAFMANTAGSMIIRTEMRPTQNGAIGYPAATVSGWTERELVQLNSAKLFHVRDVFRPNEYTNFKFYVDVDEHVVYYYVNDIYAGKTAANTAYSMLPAKLFVLYPTNDGASIGGKFWIANVKVGYTEPSAVTVDHFTIVDAMGSALDGAEIFAGDGTEAYVKATVRNETPQDVHCVIVIAQYRGSEMIDTSVLSRTVEAGAALTLDHTTQDTCQMPVADDATSIKAFIWDTDAPLTPYCDSVTAVPTIL